jgi:hypothetical protein
MHAGAEVGSGTNKLLSPKVDWLRDLMESQAAAFEGEGPFFLSGTCPASWATCFSSFPFPDNLARDSLFPLTCFDVLSHW